MSHSNTHELLLLPLWLALWLLLLLLLVLVLVFWLVLVLVLLLVLFALLLLELVLVVFGCPSGPDSSLSSGPVQSGSAGAVGGVPPE